MKTPTVGGAEARTAARQDDAVPATGAKGEAAIPNHALADDAYHERPLARVQLDGWGAKHSVGSGPGFQSRPLDDAGLRSWLGALTAGDWWGSCDPQPARTTAAPPSVEEKQRLLSLIDQMEIPSFGPYMMSTEEVPGFVADLGGLETLRRMDPGEFARKLSDDADVKRLYESYARRSTQPTLNGGRREDGTESASAQSYFIVPEHETLYLLHTNFRASTSSGKLVGVDQQLWHALPFEPSVIGARPKLREVLADVERAQTSLGELVSIAQITKDARAVIQHASQRSLWVNADPKAPDTKALEQKLTSYLEAFADKLEALYERGETRKMMREIQGAAAGVAALREIVGQQPSP